MHANITKVYASISKGEDIGEISKKHNVNATAIANIKATVEARIEANLRVLASNSYKARTISSESESPMYKGGGRPDLALGAEAAFVRADQILNDKGVHVKVTFSEINAMANQMFVNDPAGATKLVKEYIKSRGNNLSLDIPPKLNRFIKNSNAANYTSALMTTAAKLLVSDLMLKGRNKTVEDKMEITDLVIGYRTMGSDQARALAARRDPHKSPAQRAAMFLAEGLFEPDKRTLHLMGSSKNPEAIQEQWLEKTETMKEQLKAKGIDLDLILEQHQESMATKTELSQFLQSEVAKVDRKTRSIIEVFQDGGTPKMAREAAGVSLQEAKALYTAFYDKVNEAGVEAARAYSEAALAAKAPLSFAEQIGLHNPNIFDNEEAFPAPTSTSATPHNGDYNLNDSNDVEKIGQNLDNYKADIIDKIFQYRNMSILSGLQTHIVNVGSGIVYGAYEMIIKRAGVAMMNSGLNLVGQGSADAPTLPELKNLPPSFFKGISVGARMALKSYREDKRLFKKEVLGFDEVQHKKTGLKGEGNIPVPDNFYAKLLRAVSYRALTAADEGIKMWVATMEAPAQAHRIAKKEGLKPGTAAFDKRFKQLMKHDSIAWEAAVDMATKITFQTKMGEYVTTNNVRHWEGSERGLDRAIDLAAGKIQKGKFGSYGPIVKFMLQTVAPFVPTPANIYKLGFQMSPLGAFESMIDGMREIGYRKKYGAASGKIMTRARAIDDAANQVLVWSSLWVLREMMQPDDDSESPYYGVPFVTGSIGYKGTNRAERDLAYRINMPPHSIRLPAALGGHVVPYGRIEPFATALSTAVDMLAAWDRGETMPASALLFLQTVKDGAKQKTFLQGIADLANVWEDPERWGQRAIANLAVGFAPNAFIQAKNTLDPNIAETSVKGDLPFTGQVAKLVQRRVAPGADFWIFDPIPAKHSIWGEPIKRYPGDPEPSETTLLWKLYRLASPVKNIKAGEPFDVDLYIRSYNEQFPENDWTPAPPRRYIDVREGQAKSRYWLSDSEYESYIKKGGGEAKRMLDGFTWDWENPTIEGIEKIKKVYEKAYKFARDDIKSERIDHFIKDIRRQKVKLRKP